MFSVLILTYNEEQNIARCLESVSSCDDVVVLDSYSTDSTVEIARQYGARIEFRKFDNYAKQRNHGLKAVEYRNEWIVMLDADETLTEELLLEIRDRIRSCGPDVGLMRVRRKDYFLGRWIKRSSSYPLWFGRVMRPERVWVEREINEEFHTDAEVLHLEHHLYHYPFNKGFAAWIEKHNRYSTMEAELKYNTAVTPLAWRDLFSDDPTIRRKTLKKIVYSLPGRPMIIFLGLYVIKGGILDGRAGFVYCVLKMFYEYMISCKIRELKLRSDKRPL